jgi:hypothetical protein
MDKMGIHSGETSTTARSSSVGHPVLHVGVTVSICQHAVCALQSFCWFDGRHAERKATDVCGDSTALRMAIIDARLPKDVEDVALAHIAIRADNFVASGHRTYAASLRMVERRTELSQRRVQEAQDALKFANLGEFEFIEIRHALSGQWADGDRVASTFAFVRVLPTVPESLSVPVQPSIRTNGAAFPSERSARQSTTSLFVASGLLDVTNASAFGGFAQREACAGTATTQPEPQNARKSLPINQSATCSTERCDEIPSHVDAAPVCDRWGRSAEQIDADGSRRAVEVAERAAGRRDAMARALAEFADRNAGFDDVSASMALRLVDALPLNMPLESTSSDRVHRP